MEDTTTLAEIRRIVADTGRPMDSRIAAVARLVAPVVHGQQVRATAIVDAVTSTPYGTEVHPDADGDVRVLVRIGSFEEHLYVPVKEIR